MRISQSIQHIAFIIALLTPIASQLDGQMPLIDTVILTAYAWVIGIIAAIWHRTIEER